MHSAAVFDMDGLLLDSERPIRDIWRLVASEFGLVLSDEIYLQWVGRRYADVAEQYGGIFGERRLFDEACGLVRTRVSDFYEAEGFAVKTGAVELLSLLNERGIPCCVASSTRHAEVRHRLERAGLRAYFDAIAGGDEASNGKPHPDLFLLAAERLGVNPRHCLVFEDSEHGAQGALAAGMSAVIVPDLKTPAPDTAALCLAVLESLAHVPAFCEAWFSRQQRTALTIPSPARST
ncbi:HAD family phosphatase [Candidatus Methylospira mobilis]|uniref:HAD family phosphatase n=1 Tax=Candidatus Methylospira mobilis TaxID=1808979 RepID=A0A5Q0BLS2_9GAMM|nr:HAD family phosphatase [Candidatus Methylospira mobilis]QFY42706.1 HAD family phosphatase [Candidatus Methylospira mobilis]